MTIGYTLKCIESPYTSPAIVYYFLNINHIVNKTRVDIIVSAEPRVDSNIHKTFITQKYRLIFFSVYFLIKL